MYIRSYVSCMHACVQLNDFTNEVFVSRIVSNVHIGMDTFRSIGYKSYVRRMCTSEIIKANELVGSTYINNWGEFPECHCSTSANSPYSYIYTRLLSNWYIPILA